MAGLTLALLPLGLVPAGYLLYKGCETTGLEPTRLRRPPTASARRHTHLSARVRSRPVGSDDLYTVRTEGKAMYGDEYDGKYARPSIERQSILRNWN